MVEFGSGPALVVIPGIQGRWEWIAPAIHELAKTCRVLTFSLPGEPGSACAHDRAAGFEMFVRQVDEVLDHAGLDAASVCGVSFGGLVAAVYAARRPGRVRALVLASTPGPRWQPDVRARRYMRAPWMSAPAFIAGSPGRLHPEVAAALPRLGSRAAFVVRHLGRVLSASFSPARMADRVRLAGTVDFVAECGRIDTPTLIVTGEPHLDRVVPVDGTREYAQLIRGAQVQMQRHVGHMGLVTQPPSFASIVAAFVASNTREVPPRAVALSRAPSPSATAAQGRGPAPSATAAQGRGPAPSATVTQEGGNPGLNPRSASSAGHACCGGEPGGRIAIAGARGVGKELG